MTAHEAYLSYLDGLKQLASQARRRASVDDAFLQLETAWPQMSATDRLLVISKGGDPVSLLGGEPDVEKSYEWDADWRRKGDPPRSGPRRPDIGALGRLDDE